VPDPVNQLRALGKVQSDVVPRVTIALGHQKLDRIEKSFRNGEWCDLVGNKPTPPPLNDVFCTTFALKAASISSGIVLRSSESQPELQNMEDEDPPILILRLRPPVDPELSVAANDMYVLFDSDDPFYEAVPIELFDL
jgi:hypothetical protein